VDTTKTGTVAQLDQFDEIIDVRSPAEFALDHIETAINCPVLNDEERERVGTLYKQVSPFDANRLGAALVARNIARHLECTLQDRPRSWRPLVYCWRGGGRSESLCHVMQRIGWRAAKLAGGYRAYRQAVIADLERLPATLSLRVICGRTGTGKSRLLQALAAEGAQVLDLEQLARHRGSVLGELPGIKQPSQKRFESALWHELHRLDPSRPVFVEAESRKVGNVQIPPALIALMRSAPCIQLDAEKAVRNALLRDEYAHFLHTPESIQSRLQALTMHYGKDKIGAWSALAAAGRYPELVDVLLGEHYDPAYDRSIQRNFARAADAPVYRLDAPDEPAMRAVARAILDDVCARSAGKE
jgi:tRNA 2-selenouridine synthase